MPQASKKATEGFAAFKAPTQKELTERLEAKLLHHFSVQPEEATNENLYNALVLVLRDRAPGRLYQRNPQGKRQAGVLSVHGISDGAFAEKHAV